MWGQLILFISSVYCLYLVFTGVSSKNNDIKSILILAILIWIISQFFNSGDTIQIDNTIAEFLQILNISLVLTILLIIVRSLRPAIFRYPYFLVFTPLLVPLFFFLIIDTYLIKTIIFMSTQGIALLVYLLLLTEENSVTHKNIYGLVSIVLVFASYVTNWFLLDLHLVMIVLWQILLSTGILVAIYSFTRKSDNQQKYMIE
tara:strand:- start:31987 stop:32592 length:606 start_codon:yes stop_codon:yes gene_type:complete